MLLKLSDEIRECYRHAEDARRRAEATTNPDAKADCMATERLWLSLARNYEFSEQLSRFPGVRSPRTRERIGFARNLFSSSVEARRGPWRSWHVRKALERG